MAVVAAALLAVPLLLTMQFAALSNRPEVPLDKALEASLYPANLARLAVANVMGSLETTQTYWGPNFDTLPEVGATDRSFNYLFVGAAPPFCSCGSALPAAASCGRGRRLLTGVLVVALLYMLGRYTPLYALAFEYVPGINLFRRPVDAAFVFVAVLAILAGQLLADYVREGCRARRRGGCRQLPAARSRCWRGRWCSRPRRTTPGTHSAGAEGRCPSRSGRSACLCGRDRRARACRAACVATVAAAELVWWNAASSLNAEAPGYYSVLQHLRARKRRRSPSSSARSRRGARRANGRAWRS